jgi:HEAT repeat protein
MTLIASLAAALSTAPASLAQSLPDDIHNALYTRNQSVRENAQRRLIAAGGKAVPGLLAEANKERTRKLVSDLIAKMGTQSIPTLIKLLDDEKLRQRAGGVLDQVITPASAGQAKTLLACVTGKPEVKNYCGVALFKIMGPQATAQVPLLQKTLGSKDTDARYYAAGALGLIGAGARPAAPELAKRLADREPRVSFAAAQALGRIGGASKPVVLALKDCAARGGTQEIRGTAKDALKRWHE